ncbi:MAG: hypothetical protein AAGJ40_14120 [Planctomycetota bacterium]
MAIIGLLLACFLGPESQASRRVPASVFQFVALDTATAVWLRREVPGAKVDVLIVHDNERKATIDKRASSVLRSSSVVLFRPPISAMSAIYRQRLEAHGVRMIELKEPIRLQVIKGECCWHDDQR